MEIYLDANATTPVLAQARAAALAAMAGDFGNPSSIHTTGLKARALMDAVRARTHSQAWFEHFKAVVDVIPEVVEFYRMSGDIDYLLRVVVPDIAAYDKVYKRLIADTDLSDVSSSFAMEEIKFTTALPLSYVE